MYKVGKIERQKDGIKQPRKQKSQTKNNKMATTALRPNQFG